MYKTNRTLSLPPLLPLVLAFLLSALILAACASSQPVTTQKFLQPAASPTSPPTPTEINQPTNLAEAMLDVVEDPIFGRILVGNDGMTLYIFTKDTPDQSNCDASCMQKWPPLQTQGKPVLGAGVDDSKIGTAILSDGNLIVTYDHMPLYYFAKDTQPGDVNGQDVGGAWYVLNPDGKVIGIQAEADTSSANTVLDASSKDESDTGYDHGDYNDDSSNGTAASASEADINVASDLDLGSILVGNNGMTLYIFTKDEPDKSNCDANCLQNWPLLLIQSNPVLGPGVDDSKVGTVALPDGTMMVTYNHMPLYYFAKDAQPGDVNGQGVGSVWYVIDPDGDIIKQ